MDWQSRAKEFEALGEGIGALRASPRTHWTEEESLVCRARAKAALRSRRLDLLERVLDEFGGLAAGAPRPSRDHIGSRPLMDLAWEAAMDPQAFGFAQVARGQWQALRALFARQDSQGEEAKHLARWLRGGLGGAIDRGEPASPVYAASGSWEHSCPVGACFAHDNPVALAKLLGEVDFFEALAGGEPKPAAKAPTRACAKFWEGGAEAAKQEPKEGPLLHRSMAGGMGKEWLSRGAALEASLAWQAVACGAFGCAKLLLSIEEFASPMTPLALGCSNPKIQRAREPIGQDDQEEAFSLFEQAAMWAPPHPALLPEQEEGQKERQRARQQELLLWMVAKAPDQAKAARAGASWPELAVSRQALSLKDAEASVDVAFCLAILREGDSNGFSIDWVELGRRLRRCLWESHKKEPQGWGALEEWCQLRAQSKAAPASRAPSL